MTLESLLIQALEVAPEETMDVIGKFLSEEPSGDVFTLAEEAHA